MHSSIDVSPSLRPATVKAVHWRLTVGLLGVAVVLLAAWEWSFMHARELWLDESHSALLASMPIAELWTFVRGDVHPPLYFLLLNGWARVFGMSEPALRSLSLLALVGAALLLHSTARTLWGDRAGLYAALLTLFAPALFYYAGEARMYTLALFWVALACRAVAGLETGEPSSRERLRWAVTLSLALSAAAFTHYVMIFLAGGVFVVLLLRHARTPDRRLVLGSAIVSGLLFAPWLPTVMTQRTLKQHQIESFAQSITDPRSLSFGIARSGDPVAVKLRHTVENLASIAGVYPAENKVLLLALALPFLIALGVGATRAMRGDAMAQVAIAAIASTVVGVFLLGIDARRYLVPAAPLIILLMIAGVARIERWRRAATLSVAVGAGLIAICIVGSYRVLAAPQPQGTRVLARTIAAMAKPTDLILFHSAYGQIPFDYYASRAQITARRDGFPMAIREWWRPQPFKGWGAPVLTHAQVEEVAAKARHVPPGSSVWLVLFEQESRDPRNAFLSGLSREARSMTELKPCTTGTECLIPWRLFRISY